jgi:hypothetical protein
LIPSVQKLLLEFDAHLNEQPWPGPRARLMVELALVKPKGLDVVIEAWFHRMHEAKLGDTIEFLANSPAPCSPSIPAPSNSWPWPIARPGR